MRLSGEYVNRRQRCEPIGEGCAMPWEQKMLEGIARFKREQRASVLAKAALGLNIDPAREASRQRMIQMNRTRRKPPQRELSEQPRRQAHGVPPELFRAASAVVATEFGYSVPELLARARKLAYARHVLMYLLCKRGYSTPVVGRSFGMHHTSVLYGWTLGQEKYAKDEKFRERVCRLDTQIDLAIGRAA